MSDPVLPHASPPRRSYLGAVPEKIPRARAVHPHPTTARRPDVPRTPQANGPPPTKFGQRAGLTCLCRESVRALVLLDDSRRDAAALVDLDATRLRPCTDVRAALAARGGTAAAAASHAGPPRVL